MVKQSKKIIKKIKKTKKKTMKSKKSKKTMKSNKSIHSISVSDWFQSDNVKNYAKKNTLDYKVNRVINFIKKLKNVPYLMYNFNKGPTKDGPPFWIENSKPPSIKTIKKKGLVCVGIANIARRLLGLEVPGNITNYSTKNKDVKAWPGGTGAWFDYLKNKKRLKKINLKKSYPIGSLLLQDFNNKDQGHVAIVVTESNTNIMDAHVVHAIHHGKEVSKSKRYDNVVEETLDRYWNHERFTHVCLPKDWLDKN